MTKPMVRIHDTATDEVIDREMTDAEYAEYQAAEARDAAMNEAIAQAKQVKEAAQAKLEALGLTAEDLKALGI